MFNDIDLRALAARKGPERAYLSLYLSGPDAFASLDHRVRVVEALLEDHEAERTYFEENLKRARAFLEDHTFDAEALCLFACFADDYLEAFPLTEPVQDLLWVDSSPYIRPLAELQDEYENFAVVAADNTRARLFLVTSAVAEEEKRVRGDVKNDVKVGGWSQKRYERRRDQELQQYAQDVAAALQELDREADFDRVVLVGADEAMQAIQAALPPPMAERVSGAEAVDLSEEDAVWKEAYALFFEDERAEEADLWERIKGAYLRGGRAAVGPADVLEKAAVGRVDTMIVVRDAGLKGVRCRECENLSAGTPDRCPVCGSASVFTEDLVNELVELCAATGARVEFADALPSLEDMGPVAALLRY